MATLTVTYDGVSVNQDGDAWRVSPARPIVDFTWSAEKGEYHALTFSSPHGEGGYSLLLFRVNMRGVEGEQPLDLVPVRAPDVTGKYIATLYRQQDRIRPSHSGDAMYVVASVVVDLTPLQQRIPTDPSRAQEISYDYEEFANSPADLDGTEEHGQRWVDKRITTGARYVDSRVSRPLRSLKHRYAGSRTAPQGSPDVAFCRCVYKTPSATMGGPYQACSKTGTPTTDCAVQLRYLLLRGEVTDADLRRYARAHGITLPSPYSRESAVHALTSELPETFVQGSDEEKAYCDCVVRTTVAGTPQDPRKVCRAKTASSSRRCGDIIDWNTYEDNELVAYARAHQVQVPRPYSRDGMIARLAASTR